MENSLECIQCIQLSKRVKEEKAKNSKKKNLINLFKELLYAHDIKLSNFSRTNLRDVYNKYLIDGEHVRQRLSSTLSSLNEITEAYSAANQSNESLQKKAQDLEAKLKHLEFLNKQLSEYYNQVETQNKKQKAESKPSKLKKGLKKTDKKLNIKVESKSDPIKVESRSDPPSPLSICNDKAANIHSNKTDFPAENSVVHEESGAQENGLDNAISDSIKINSNLSSKEQENVTFEQELLKAKDFLDSFSDCETHSDYISDEDDLMEISSTNQLLTNCFPDKHISITKEQCNLLVDGYETVSSEENISEETNKLRRGHVLKNDIYNGGSPVDSGIFSANTSPAISEISEVENLEHLHKINKQCEETNKCSDPQLTRTKEIMKKPLAIPNCVADNICEKDNNITEMQHLSCNYIDNYTPLKSVGENVKETVVNQIVDNHSLPNITSPVRSSKKTAEHCIHNPAMSKDLKQREVNENIKNNISESSQVSNSYKFSRDTINCSEKESESIFQINEDISDNKIENNDEQVEGIFFSTAPEIRENEQARDKKKFIKQNCIFPKSKLLLSNPKTVRPHSTWCSSKESINWIEKLKLQDSNSVDYNDLCKVFNKNMKLKSKPMKKSKYQKQTGSTLYNNLFKSVTSNGLAQATRVSNTSVSEIKTRTSFRVFGDFTEKSRSNESNCDQDFYTFPNNHENLFSSENASKKYFSHLRGGFKTNYDSFFRYRDNNREQHISYQIKCKENEKNTNSVTISYRLITNDFGYPCQDEILKFSLIHPIVKINGLKDTCIVVNSMYDLVSKIRVFTDELERFYVEYINKTHANKFSFNQWNCKNSSNEFITDSKHKEQSMPTYNNYMCGRDTAFSRIPCHQSDNFQIINDPSWTCCQTLCSNINPMLMKSCFNPNLHCSQENIGTHSEQCNINMFKDVDSPSCVSSNLKGNVLIRKSSFPSHSCNSANISRELHQNISSENTISFSNASQDSILLLSQPNSPISVASNSSDFSAKNRSSFAASPANNNLTEQMNKMKKKNSEGNEKQPLIQNTKKERKQADCSSIDDFGKLAVNEKAVVSNYVSSGATRMKYSDLSEDHDCQDTLLLASKTGPKSTQFNKDNTKFIGGQSSEAITDVQNLTPKAKVHRNNGQRITDSINSSKIEFNDKVALKSKYVSLNSPIKEVELTNNFQNKGAIKHCINHKPGSYSDVQGCSKSLLKKCILGTPSISGNDANTAINNSNTPELSVAEQVEIMSTHNVSKLDGIRSSIEMRLAKDGKNNLLMKACKEKYISNTSSNKQSVTCDSGNRIISKKENMISERLPISHSNNLFHEKSKKKESKKSIDISHSVIQNNEKHKIESTDDNSKNKKNINHSSSDSSQNRAISNQNVNLGKKNMEDKLDDLGKKVESSSTNKSCNNTPKKTKNGTKCNKQIFTENRIQANQNTLSALNNPQNLLMCNQNVNSGKIFVDGVSVDKKDEIYTKNKSCVKNNTPTKSKKELNTNNKTCKENLIQAKIKTPKKRKCNVTESETSINENFGNEGINSNNAKVVTGNEMKEDEISEINATLNSIMKEYELIKPLSPLPEIEEDPEVQTSPIKNISPKSVMKKNCNSIDGEEKQKSLSQENPSVMIDQSMSNAIEELGNLNIKKINYSENKAEDLYNLTLSLFDQTAAINNNKKSNILENNDHSNNSIYSHIINNMGKEIQIGTTEKLISDPSICHNVKQNDTEIITVNKVIDNKRNEYITADLTDIRSDKCSTSLKLLSLEELHKESLPTVAMVQQGVIMNEKEGHYSPSIYDLDSIEKDLVINNEEIELSGMCNSVNEAELPIVSEIEIVTSHDNSSVELKSNSCSNNDGLPSEIANLKPVRPGEENEAKEHSTPKIENNPTQMPTIKDRLRPRKDSFALTPVKVSARRLNRKSCSPKPRKLLSNGAMEEIEKTQIKKKEITDETNIDVDLGDLPNLELELGDISLNDTLSSYKSDDVHRLNELYNEVDNLILDYRGDETKLSFDSQPQLSYLPNMSTRNSAAKLEDSMNVSAGKDDQTILQKENHSSSEKERKETTPICIGFYRDRSEEEEKTEAQNESVSKKIPLSPNYLNDSDQHLSSNILGGNKLESFSNSIDSNVPPFSPCERRADKRKRSLSDLNSNLNSKNPRITSSEEIIDCKDDSAMRASLRYITNKILQEGKPSIIKRKKIEIEIEDKRVKGYIDSFVATSNENSDKLHAVIDELNTFDIKIVVSAIIETIVSDKQEMIAPIGSNRMPPLTQVQKRLLMLTISLAQFNKLVYDEVLNSLEESFASFRDKTIHVTNGCKMIFFYTVLCRSQGFLSRARSLLLDILYTRNRKAFPVVLKMVTIWPFIIPHASFSSGCLLTSVFIYILSSTYTGPDRTAKREAAALKKNIMTKYGYSDRGQESQLTRDELFREILSRITERGSDLALVLLAKFEGNIWATKMVESALVPLLQKWLHAEKTAVGNNRNDSVAAEIALALGRIVRGFPKLSSRILINNSIKIFEHMLNETNNFIVMEAVVEALVMLRRHNLPMCAAALAKWHPKGNIITTKIVDLIRSVLSVKPLTHWLRFLSHIDS